MSESDAADAHSAPVGNGHVLGQGGVRVAHAAATVSVLETTLRTVLEQLLTAVAHRFRCNTPVTLLHVTIAVDMVNWG